MCRTGCWSWFKVLGSWLVLQYMCPIPRIQFGLAYKCYVVWLKVGTQGAKFEVGTFKCKGAKLAPKKYYR